MKTPKTSILCFVFCSFNPSIQNLLKIRDTKRWDFNMQNQETHQEPNLRGFTMVSPRVGCRGGTWESILVCTRWIRNKLENRQDVVVGGIVSFVSFSSSSLLFLSLSFSSISFCFLMLPKKSEATSMVVFIHAATFDIVNLNAEKLRRQETIQYRLTQKKNLYNSFQKYALRWEQMGLLLMGP